METESPSAKPVLPQVRLSAGQYEGDSFSPLLTNGEQSHLGGGPLAWPLSSQEFALLWRHRDKGASAREGGD